MVGFTLCRPYIKNKTYPTHLLQGGTKLAPYGSNFVCYPVKLVSPYTIMKFHIDWKGETGGRIRVNINNGAFIESYEVCDNKYIAESYAKNMKHILETLGHECTLMLDDGRLD